MEQTRLKTAVLGKTGLQITRVGFGAWALGGGGWQFGWGQQDNEDSISAIHHALDLGINWIDTAAAYGFGRSEQVRRLHADAIIDAARLQLTDDDLAAIGGSAGRPTST